MHFNDAKKILMESLKALAITQKVLEFIFWCSTNDSCWRWGLPLPTGILTTTSKVLSSITQVFFRDRNTVDYWFNNDIRSVSGSTDTQSLSIGIGTEKVGSVHPYLSLTGIFWATSCNKVHLKQYDILKKMMNWSMCGLERECNNVVSLTSIFFRWFHKTTAEEKVNKVFSVQWMRKSTVNANTDRHQIYLHLQYFNSLQSKLLHWLCVQAVRLIQMPCKCLSLKQPSNDLNVAHKSCLLLPSLRDQDLRQKKN